MSPQALWWKCRRRLMGAFTRIQNPSASFGERLMVDGHRPYIVAEGELIAGARLYFQAPTRAAEIRVGPRAALRLGDHVFINDGVHIEARLSITIGSHCLIAQNAAIMDTDFHQVDEGREARCAEVVIEDNVWLGRGAIVLPGVTVGRNSVIAAGAVVTSSVPANTLAAGVPAIVKRKIRAGDGFVRR